MQLTLATKNAGKVREIKKILPEFDIQTMTEAGIELDIEENGETFEENALIKARAIWKVCGGLVIADDSGLEIDYLGGQPGVHSSRFMGEDTDYVIKNRELIHRLEKAKEGERKARFVAVIACILPDGNLLLVERWRGKLQWSLRAQRALAMIPFSISQIMDVQVHKLVWKRKIRLVIEEKH